MTFFIINRHQTETLELDVSIEGFCSRRVILDKGMAGDDRKAANGPGAEIVGPRDGEGAEVTRDRLVAAIAFLSGDQNG